MNLLRLLPVMALPLSACHVLKSATPAPAHPQFVRDVRPILQERCAVCHNRKLIPHGWSIENRALAFTPKPGRGLLIRPQDPANSPLLLAITAPASHPHAMPPLNAQVPEREVEILRRWIADGAPWPAGPDGVITPPRAPDDI